MQNLEFIPTEELKEGNEFAFSLCDCRKKKYYIVVGIDEENIYHKPMYTLGGKRSFKKAKVKRVIKLKPMSS